mmetsp:Transcript_116264/g.325177  ORF Transcript_116264/g.325177 Transcript_116264/m.325177 type:complete len:266 (-) Transcript_116264:110-907(-)
MATHGQMAIPLGGVSNMEVFWRSLALVGVAELFDKTWFMGLIFALRYGPRVVFAGSFAALFLHCFLAAALGLAFARLVPKVVLSYATAALFFAFAAMYAKDCYMADPDSDAIEAGKEDVAEELGENEDAEKDCTVAAGGRGETAPAIYGSMAGGLKKPAHGRAAYTDSDWAIFGKSFMAVFIAEWGDRTQIAMISQHASQPVVPVFLGSVLAFFLLTLSAVGAASLLNGQKLKERVVFGFASLCFLLFAAMALKDAVEMSHSVVH